jgi:GDPmannose 4,6-dehydratase
MSIALITGISGQTGSYLAEHLLDKGYEVHGIIRRSSLIKTDRIDHIFDNVTLHYGDMTDGMNLMSIIQKINPTEIYNLAAQSHVQVSFETPEYTANADGLGTLRLLEIIKNTNIKIKFFQASTSEMFGSSNPPQNENTTFQPQSPYAVAKLYSYWLTKNYRDAYGIFAVNGIMFNHEGPRRGETFITRKVTRHVANLFLDKNIEPLKVGNIYAIRDWTDARDMVKGIHLSMKHKIPDDFVFGSGVGRSILDLLIRAFKEVNIKLEWDNDLNLGIDINSGKVLVEVNDRYKRPLEVNALIADFSKSQSALDWKGLISFDTMISEMIKNDINEITKRIL